MSGQTGKAATPKATTNTDAAPKAARAGGVQTRAVSDDEQDIRLDRWFRRHFPWLTQAMVQKLCRTGQVRADGARVDAATRLQAGQTLRIPPLPPRPDDTRAPPRPLDARAQAAIAGMVLYQDEDVIVLNKPPGLSVQGGPGITEHIDGMLDGLRFDSPHRPRLVHRIDRDTSGILLLARSPGVAAKLAALFRQHDLEKIYWALVLGRPNPPEQRIDLPLAKVGNGAGARTAPTEAGMHGVRALSFLRTLDAAGKRLSFVELIPQTGRTHQLRVHTAAIGHPIFGDPKYGFAIRAAAGDFPDLADRLHLHARALSLPHPAGGRLHVEAPLPPHMRDSFRILGFEAPAPARPRRG